MYMQIFRRFGFVAVGGVLMLALAGVAAAPGSNAVANGDFQTGSLAHWNTFTTSNGMRLPSRTPRRAESGTRKRHNSEPELTATTTENAD
jgi:hypothetical protein